MHGSLDESSTDEPEQPTVQGAGSIKSPISSLDEKIKRKRSSISSEPEQLEAPDVTPKLYATTYDVCGF